MHILYTKEGQLIGPHLEHTLQSFYYNSEISIYFQDAEGHALDFYPTSHWLGSEHGQSIESQLSSTIKQLYKSQSERLTSYTYMLEGQFTFLMVPVSLNQAIKGIFIAGPFIMDALQKSGSLDLSNPLIAYLQKISLIKKPPRHLFIGQLLQHLIQNSIYIGPQKVIHDTKHYLSKNDMENRFLNHSLHKKLTFLTDLVFNAQKKEALAIYQKMVVLQDFFPETEHDATLMLKQHLLTIENRISNRLLEENYDYKRIAKIKHDFFKQILVTPNYACLTSCGETMIKVYSEIVRQKSMEGLSLPVRKCLYHIHEHFKEHLTLDVLCRHANRSKSYLSSRFSQEVGMTFSEYMKQTRIKYSQNLLTHTDATILEIALESGFESQNYYATVFKNMTGMTPLTYRSRHGR